MKWASSVSPACPLYRAGSAHALYPYKIFVVFVWEDRLTRPQLLETRSQLVGQLQFDEETRREPSHPSKVQENGKWTLDFLAPYSAFDACYAGDRSLPNWILTRKIRNLRDVFRSGKDGEYRIPRICRFVKLLVNEGFLAVKTGCKLRESNSIIRKLITKCKHMYGNIFRASCWCRSQTNPHFKQLYASPKSNFSQFWRYLLTEPLSDCLVLFLKSRVDNLEDRYNIFTSVLYLHNGLKHSKQRFCEFLSSLLLNPKETEYKAEDISAELAHPLFEVKMIKGRCVTCRKSISRYHAWSPV